MLPPGAPAPLVAGLPPYDGPPPGNITAIFYSQLACTVVLFYEWFITFDVELDRIWTRRKSGFTVYWAFVRYTPLVTRVLDEIAIHKMNWSDQLVLFPLVTLWLAEIALDIWPLARPNVTANRVPGPGCMAQLWTTEIVVAQLCTIIAFDTLVLSLIVGRCLMVFVCNVTNLILLFHSHVGSLHTDPSSSSIVISKQFVIQQSFLMFSLAIPSLMVNRMLLSLRAFESPKHCPVDQTMDQTTPQTLALTYPHSVMDAIIDEFGDDVAREYHSGRTRPRLPVVQFA
ncbi:hypothetical protein AURDEDRAFT_171123 [Auricularia subglabra TFB-10046 SS5]|nr:hypothetical protein AURDEDRAFT_171123 [Auricularia subglabra TFB-10046 SS5]